MKMEMIGIEGFKKGEKGDEFRVPLRAMSVAGEAMQTKTNTANLGRVLMLFSSYSRVHRV